MYHLGHLKKMKTVIVGFYFETYKAAKKYFLGTESLQNTLITYYEITDYTSSSYQVAFPQIYANL